MSLDGFIAGPNEGPGNGLGDGGHRLHEWFPPGVATDRKALSGLAGVNGQVVAELMATGAVVAGRGTFELERTRILEGEAGVTHVHYRVQH
jgi:hypothetical protein